MYTYQVPTPATIPVASSRRARAMAIAVALAITIALVIASIVASQGSSAATATPLPQQRDLAPSRAYRDPQTHALLWTAPVVSAQPKGRPAASPAASQALRPDFPGK